MLIRKIYTKNNGYLEVSDKGDIYHDGVELRKVVDTQTGYIYVKAYNSRYFVHTLIASAFAMSLEEATELCMCIASMDRKKDNRIENPRVIRMEEVRRELYRR